MEQSRGERQREFDGFLGLGHSVAETQMPSHSVYLRDNPPWG